MTATHEPAPRPKRLRWGVFVFLTLAVMIAVGIARFRASGGFARTNLAEGEIELARALMEDTSLEPARRHFKDAASVSVIDHYPAFMIHVARRLETLRGGAVPEGPEDQVLLALDRGDLRRAADEASKIGTVGDRRRGYYERLIVSIAKARPSPE